MTVDDLYEVLRHLPGSMQIVVSYDAGCAEGTLERAYVLGGDGHPAPGSLVLVVD